jgi:hypothetical protein
MQGFRKCFDLRDSAGLSATIVKSTITSAVVDFVSTTSISLVFLSDSEKEMTEVIYSQPIDPNATIFSMKIEVDGRTIESSIREKSDAAHEYEEAVKSGHGAYLGRVSVDEPDVYQLCIGNLPPKTQVLVTVSYLSEALLEDNSAADKSTLRISYPIGMFPRYTPAGRSPFLETGTRFGFGTGTGTGTSGEGISDIPIDIEVKIQQPCGISSISSKSDSPLHIRFGRSGNQSAVIKTSTSSIVGDFVLIVERFDGYKSCLWVPFGTSIEAESSESDWVDLSADFAGSTAGIGSEGGGGEE